MNKNIKNITVSGLMTALGMILPMLTGQIPEIGKALLPMHIPVFLCTLICGWKYGAAVGAVLPLLRTAVFGMPPLYPVAVAMTFELAVYGLVTGFLYFKMKRLNSLFSIYISMLTAMILGRIVWGAAEIVLLSIKGNVFTVEMFISGALVSAVPGIILQLVLIPAVMVSLEKAGVVERRAAV